MTEQAPKVFGIDSGTTFSCIAHVDEYGQAVTIPNEEGDRITPSVVFFDGNNRVVGKEAKNVAVLYEQQVVEMVKRNMGRGDWIFSYDGKDYTPEEISSYILRKVVGDAEKALGFSISDVVITCPAYFGINEREATAKAGEIAGLKVRSIINEPTAAAIAYGMHQDKDQVVLVYDLGGGTFDITMIEIKSGEINVIATGGDHQLGGRDWDGVLVSYLAEQWKIQVDGSADPEADPETLQDLFSRAEQAKQTLSAREKTDVVVTHAGQRQKITVTREKFNELTANLLERTIAYTRAMLKEAEKKGYIHFDQFLLVGGSTKMPQVTERIRAEFNIEPKSYEPDEAVAKGAALYGQKLAIGDQIRIKIESWGYRDAAQVPAAVNKKAQQAVADDLGLSLPPLEKLHQLAIVNVTSRSFGVVALKMPSKKEIVSNIIKMNQRLPAQVTQRFGTVEDDQGTAEIRIMESLVSEDEAALTDCDEIGNTALSLPPRLPANAPIEITFSLDEQGRLHATARELSTNGSVEADIQTSRVISQEQLAEAKERSKQLVVS